MIFDNSPPPRRFFVPAVVQTSAMDCGPATLKSLLAGFQIHVSDGRIRSAYQTQGDGTSIDTLEGVANQLGLETQQIMVPADHLFLPDVCVLPAVVLTRLSNGLTHFIILWRDHGRFIQVMDPSVGRRWLTQRQLVEELYLHTQLVPIDIWYEWASSDSFCDPLRQRLANLEVIESEGEALIQKALSTGHWKTLATLDAVTRMTTTLVHTGGITAGTQASDILTHFFTQALTTSPHLETPMPIPTAFWSVQPENETQLLFHAVELIQIVGLKVEAPAEEETFEPPPAFTAAVTDLNPERYLWQMLKVDGFLTPSLLLVAVLFATLGVTLVPLLFKFLLDMGQQWDWISERVNTLQVIFGFLGTLLLLQVAITATSVHSGRHLEARLRLAFLQKIPHLSDHYFHSRLIADMAQRDYGFVVINQLPLLAVNLLQLVFTLILTAVGIIFFSPDSFWLIILVVGIAIGVPYLAQPVLREQDMCFRTHEVALNHFYLDTLLGFVPIRTHSTDRRREHERLLVNDFRAGLDFAQVRLLIISSGLLVNTGLAIWIVFNYVERGGESSGILVLLYWILRLPLLGTEIAMLVQQYPMLRNRVLHLLETEMAGEIATASSKESACATGVAIEWQQVQVGAPPILRDLSLKIAAGEHIAIVGSSGAGKSSLVGLLLGCHRCLSGDVFVDGKRLQGATLQRLRQETAWVDPCVQIWNRSLRDNLYYGTDEKDKSFKTLIEQADLLAVLEKLPDAERTVLGEGGGLLSESEGQRVRFGRALCRPHARLVILDEPFHGLDPQKRHALLVRARHYWKEATLLFISQGISETQTFERVLVMEEGQIVEDGSPTELLAQLRYYSALLAAEKAVHQALWENEEWRHLWLENGQLQERFF